MNSNSTILDDHEAVWGDDIEMLEKTRAYHQRVKKALRKGMVESSRTTPWDDDDSDNRPDIPWRLRVFELAGDDAPRSCHFENPRELRHYWRTAPNDVQRARRVVILEDMNSRMVELLGVLLDMPPEFFLAHCDNNLNLTVVDRFYAKKSSSTYWKVNMPQNRRAPAGFDGPQAQYKINYGTFRRGVAHFGKGIKFTIHTCPVSYWGSTHADGVWTGKWASQSCRNLRLTFECLASRHSSRLFTRLDTQAGHRRSDLSCKVQASMVRILRSGCWPARR
jgi:hypothetical protein